MRKRRTPRKSPKPRGSFIRASWKFTEHFEKIRAGLERANSAFNEATASFQTRIRPAGERLADLGGAGSAKELPDIQPLGHDVAFAGSVGLKPDLYNFLIKAFRAANPDINRDRGVAGMPAA